MPEASIPVSNDWLIVLRSRLRIVLSTAMLATLGVISGACRGSSSANSEASETRVKSTLHLETFVLNLADTDQRSYLRVGIDLGLNHEARRGEDPVPMAEVRDTILSVLGEAKVDDLLSAGGKARLKESLLHALQERMPEAGVEEVCFTEFLIQR